MVNLGYGFFGGKNITGGGVGKSYNYQRRSMDVVAFTVGNIRSIFTRYINKYTVFLCLFKILDNDKIFEYNVFKREGNMASDLDYVKYVIDQIKTNGKITYKKMFGEYLIYSNNKPVVMVCDNTTFVKMYDCIKPLMENVETGSPYKGAKEHYIVNH